MTGQRFLISGRVQGVFFRAWTQRKAQSLGLMGHAINLPSGQVEVVACGPADQIDQLRQWLRSGPPLARVESIEQEPAEITGATAFTIG
ncbi:MAG: acylphosphatase [Pseudomonadota bacterium]